MQLLQGQAGDYIAVDLGYARCRQRPTSLALVSPVHQLGPPTDFTSDAASTGLQPSAGAPTWQNLLTARDYHADMPRSGYLCNLPYKYQSCGSLLQNYSIAQPPAQLLGPVLVADTDELPELAFTIGAAEPVAVPLEAGGWFQGRSGVCCLSISAHAVDDTNSSVPLPSWLTFWHNLTNSSTTPSVGVTPSLQEQYQLLVAAELGLGLVGEYTIRITAEDPNLPDSQPTSLELPLSILGTGPTVVDAYPIVAVADAQLLQYSLDRGVFLLNQPVGSLSYSSDNLPAWAELSPQGVLSGFPRLGRDRDYTLNITVADVYGEENSAPLQLQVRAACPAGSFRHFRVKITGITTAYWGMPC